MILKPHGFSAFYMKTHSYEERNYNSCWLLVFILYLLHSLGSFCSDNAPMNSIAQVN
jgi:hypothetical protein